MTEILRYCPSDCRDEERCAISGKPLPYDKSGCYRPPKDVVETDDSSKCPRCGSTDVSWCGGDSDSFGSGHYFHMYVCNNCGRRGDGVQVFLVPCSKEDYGHDPRELPGDPDEVEEIPFRYIECSGKITMIRLPHAHEEAKQPMMTMTLTVPTGENIGNLWLKHDPDVPLNTNFSVTVKIGPPHFFPGASEVLM